MGTLTEVQQPDWQTGKAVQNASRAHVIWALGTSAIVSVWLWAAFVRDQGHSLLLQSVLLAVVFVGITAGCWFVICKLILQQQLRLSFPASTATLAFASSAFLLSAVFLPEYLLGGRPGLARSVLLLTCVLCLLIAYLAVSLRSPAPAKASRSIVSAMMVAAGGFIYFVLTSYITIEKLHAFGYVGQDIAYFTQCLHTALHGHLFYSNMYHDLLYAAPVSSDFAGHNQPVLALFLPFYALHRSAVTLLIVRNVFVALCAWPVYLISRRTLAPWLSAVAAVAFLLVPSILYQNLYDFAPLSLAGFPLLFAFYYFMEGRFWPFLLAIVCTQIVREDLVFVIFGLGLLALWERRNLRWAAVPCAFAVAWAFLSWKVIIPHFLHGTTSVVASCFTYLGNTPTRMVHGLFGNLRLIASRTNLIYVKQVVTPFGGLLFLASPVWILSLPYVAINVLGQEGGCNTAMVYRHYSMIPAVVLFVSFLMSVEKVGMFLRTKGKDPYRAQAAMVLFVLAAAIVSLVLVTGKQQADDLRSYPWHEEARTVASLIPPGASVAAPRYLLPSLANRDQIYQSLRLLEYHHPDAEFVVLDRNWERMAATEQWRDNYEALWKILKYNPKYKVIYDSPNYVIYQRCAGCTEALEHRETPGSLHD